MDIVACIILKPVYPGFRSNKSQGCVRTPAEMAETELVCLLNRMLAGLYLPWKQQRTGKGDILSVPN
jgi:hypothetical protein